MKLIKVLALSSTLIACSPDNGTNGINGTSPELNIVEMEIESFRGGPNYKETFTSNYFITIPSSLFLEVAHSSGSPGWATIILSDKTFCYQAIDSNSTTTGKRYDLRAVRKGEDTSCTTGNGTNVSHSNVEYSASGETLEFTIHTPRIANGTSVTIKLSAYTFL